MKRGPRWIVLLDQTYLKAFGTIYEDTKYISRFSEPLWHTSIFCIRRLFVAIAVVFSQDFLLLQVAVYAYANILMLGFYMNVKPLQDKFSNIIETLNESFVLLTFYHVVIFLPGLMPEEF